MSTRAQWREHVRAWRASGETAAAFCRRAGLNPSTLTWWAWKLGSEPVPNSPGKPSASAALVNFVELTPVDLGVGHFELEVACVVVRVPTDFDAAALGRLLDTLEARR